MTPTDQRTVQSISPATAAIPSLPPGVRRFTLPNGLDLIVREDHTAPVVSAQGWCRAGSIHEGKWLGAGLSHVLEHMLFKGTTTRGPGRIDQEIQAVGGYINAYTSLDRTVYWINTPNNGARVAVDILCDILQNASLPEDELIKELEVIRREMAMGNDDPGRRSSRALFQTAFPRSPYRHPVIGIPDIFNKLTRADIASYYEAHYAPNNCFLVVVGDVSADAIYEQVSKAFAGTPARSVPELMIPSEPRQLAPREWIEEAPVELAHFHLAWHVPDMRHADTPCLDVLSTLLGSGRSSRLYQAVREKAGWVHGIHSWMYCPGSVGLFGVSGTADADKLQAARDEILAEIERMKVERVSSAELTKAVKQFTSATLSTLKTMEGQAQDLGSNWLSTHDLNFSERYLASVRQITPEDLRRVAQQYLGESNRIATALVPTGTTPPLASAEVIGVEHKTQRYVLSNGLRLLVKPDHRLPFVQFRIAFNGGLLVETPENSGVHSLMCRMLVKGSRQRTGAELAEAIEGLGGSLEPFSGNHSFGLSAEVLSMDFAQGLELFTETLLHPTWPADALKREKEVQNASLRAQRDQLLQLAVRSMRRQLYGDVGYGLDPLGSEESIKNLTTTDLQECHSRGVCPANGVLAVFGDVHPEAVRGAVESALAPWKGTPVEQGNPSIPPRQASRWEENRQKEQAVLILGFPGTTLDHTDRFALDLLHEACSDMGSRLFLRIRDELSLAYYVGTSNFAGRIPGHFAFYCGTAPEKVDLVESELRREAAELAKSGLTEAELDRAKAKLVGQRKIARQDLGHQAITAALHELQGMGLDQELLEEAAYDAVTLDDIRTVAARYLRPEESVLALIRGTAGKPAGS